MSERDPASVDDSGEANEPLYWYKPALIGSPWVFRLKPDGLAWETGGRSGLIRYQRVRRVRLSFRPLTMQSYRFITEIWSDDAPKLQFASTTWRSLTDQGRQDADYREFVTELHRRFSAANATAQFVAGIPLATFVVGVIVSAIAAAAFVGIAYRALEISERGAAAVICGFLLIFGWQVGNYLYRNRPMIYRPDALPLQLMPRGERT